MNSTAQLQAAFLERTEESEAIAREFRKFLDHLWAQQKEEFENLFIFKKRAARTALGWPQDSLDRMLESGLLLCPSGQDSIASAVMVHRNILEIEEGHLDPCDWYIATDWPDIPPDTDLGVSAVFAIHYESIYLLRTLREDPGRSPRGKSVVDVFCGSGVLGIYAALLEAKEVLSLDIEERALSFTRLNGVMNGVSERLTIRRSDIFKVLDSEPEIDARFDLILANPPFEPIPDGTRYFRHSDGGVFGQKLTLRFLAEAGNYLAADGRIVAVDLSPGGGPSGKEIDGKWTREKICLCSDLLASEMRPWYATEHRVEIQFVDRMPLKLFGARFGALGMVRYPEWQLTVEDRGYDWLYFIWIEVSATSESEICHGDGGLALLDVRDRRLATCRDWENPYRWTLPSGIPLEQSNVWIGSYQEAAQRYNADQVSLEVERFMSGGGTPAVYDFTLLADDAERLGLVGAQECLEGSVEALLSNRLLGHLHPAGLVLYAFQPRALRGTAVDDVFVAASGYYVLGELSDRLRGDGRPVCIFKQPKVRVIERLRDFSQGEPVLLVKVDVLEKATEHVARYEDIVRVSIAWRTRGYPMMQVPGQRGVGVLPEDAWDANTPQVWDRRRSDTQEGAPVNVAQSFVLALWFPESVHGAGDASAFDRIFGVAGRPEDPANLRALHRESGTLVSRLLTVLVQSALSVKHVEDVRRRVGELLHDVRNEITMLQMLKGIRDDIQSAAKLGAGGAVALASDLHPGSDHWPYPGPGKLSRGLDLASQNVDGVFAVVSAYVNLQRGLCDPGRLLAVHEMPTVLGERLLRQLRKENAAQKPMKQLRINGGRGLTGEESEAQKDVGAALADCAQVTNESIVLPWVTLFQIAMHEMIRNAFAKGTSGSQVDLTVRICDDSVLVHVSNEFKGGLATAGGGLGRSRLRAIASASNGVFVEEALERYWTFGERDATGLAARVWDSRILVDLRLYRARRATLPGIGSLWGEDLRSEFGSNASQEKV